MKKILKTYAIVALLFYAAGAIQGMDDRAQAKAEGHKLMRDRINKIK